MEYQDVNSAGAAGHMFKAKLLDFFVSIHAVVAFAFASCMVIYPAVFSAFSVDPIDNDSVTADAIRWASPFVFGFAFLAGLSLRFGPNERRLVAGIFAGSFWIATGIGSWVQSNGRWSVYHAVNLVLFSSLAMTYTGFLVFCKQAFLPTRKR